MDIYSYTHKYIGQQNSLVSKRKKTTMSSATAPTYTSTELPQQTQRRDMLVDPSIAPKMNRN